MKLYFGTTQTTLTTIFILVLLGFIGFTTATHNNINYWGRRTLIVAIFGLFICCYAAARDGLDKTIQHMIDGSCNPGIFSLNSVTFVIGCIGAAVIIISGIVSIFSKSQNVRQTLFYVMSGGVLLKIVTVEISRIVLTVKA